MSPDGQMDGSMDTCTHACTNAWTDKREKALLYSKMSSNKYIQSDVIRKLLSDNHSKF